MIILAGTLGTLNYFFVETSRQQWCALAPTIWQDLYQRLSASLGASSDRMAFLAESQGVYRFDVSPTPVQPDTPERDRPVCMVCLDRRPTVALRSCGHVFCGTCVIRIRRCPVCRTTVIGRLRLFF